MITSFYEWRDVSFLYARLVCNVLVLVCVCVFGNINTYFVSNDFIIAIIFFSFIYAFEIALQFLHCIHSLYTYIFS